MKTKEIIKQLMDKYPELKDNDYRLISNYWAFEIKKQNLDIEIYKPFLKMYAKTILTNAETIRRMRAKVQEEEPQYRGKLYNKRQKLLSKKWQQELGYNVELSCEIKKKYNKPYIIGKYDEY